MFLLDEKSLATLGEVSLTASNLLRRLNQARRLVPLLHEVVAEECVLLHAKEAGLTVTDAELQKAAGYFRHRHGLTQLQPRNSGSPANISPSKNSRQGSNANCRSRSSRTTYSQPMGRHTFATTSPPSPASDSGE